MAEFKKGDIVEHKSAPGIKMVVTEVASDGRLGCRWHKTTEDKFEFQYFQPEELELRKRD